MRIRTRLSLWYAAVMLASLSLMGALSYHEFVVQRSAEPGQRESLSGRGEQGRPPQPDDRPDTAREREPRAGRPGGGGRRHGLFAEVMTILVRVGIPAIAMAVAGHLGDRKCIITITPKRSRQENRERTVPPANLPTAGAKPGELNRSCRCDDPSEPP